MKNVVKITRTQLIKMLLNWNFGAQPSAIQYLTSPKLNREGKAKFGDIIKIANVGGIIGYSYENSVNNQREREEMERNFIAQPLWNGKGKRLSSALSTHIEKETFYLTYKAQQTFKSFHFDAALQFIPLRLLKQYFPVYKSKKQGTEKQVFHREIAIENIKKLKFKKTTYVIVPD